MQLSLCHAERIPTDNVVTTYTSQRNITSLEVVTTLCVKCVTAILILLHVFPTMYCTYKR